MADHIDGPRTTADPSIDVTDLFAFTSPVNSARTVMIANVFPFAGETALFSNAADHCIVLRRVRVAGTGGDASFQAYGPELRFTFRFDVLKPAPNGGHQHQTGTCTLPDGRSLPLVVGDEAGSVTPDGAARVFVGRRSDPFFIGWFPGKELKRMPNFLQEDNVLSLVVEFDTASMLTPAQGSLFGAIAETVPRGADPDSNTVPRFDWIGRPEQTNFRLNGMLGAPDLRDLWNQQTPFAIDPEALPLFRRRLTDSLIAWDMRDGKADWAPSDLAANVNVFLDDFLLFDVRKPIDDLSHLEIEKSTINGHPYASGGGRTLNANVIDILVTWLVNRDRGPFMQSATQATQPGGPRFPYVQPPNTRLLTITRSTDVVASPQAVWQVVGQFGGHWHPLVADVQTTGSGVGQLRRISTIDGKTIVEQLKAIDDGKRILRYAMVTGVPASPYEGIMEVRPNGSGSTVTWTVNYRPEGQGELIVNLIVSTLLGTGIKALKARFG